MQNSNPSPAIETHTLPTTTHGRFLVSAGAPGAALVVGFHGYAERAEDQLPRLLETRASVDGSWTVASVQGLHSFYRARTGEVVASWMTRENRELAIADNVAWVRLVVEDLRARHGATGPLFFAGFSQGVAMAFRAAAFAGFPVAGVVALAADVPPDVAATGLAAFPPVLLARGSEDIGYRPEHLAQDAATLADHGVRHETFTFEGAHQWLLAFSAKAGAWITERLA